MVEVNCFWLKFLFFRIGFIEKIDFSYTVDSVDCCYSKLSSSVKEFILVGNKYKEEI